MITLVADCLGRTLTFPLRDEAKEVRGGSLPDNTIYLPFRGISRHHFVLKKDAKGWLVQDLGSRNGVVVNAKKVARARIKPGDEILVGIIKIRVEESTSETQPLPIPEPRAGREEDSGTDRVGHVSMTEYDQVYSFPNLVFPPGMIMGKSLLMLDVCQKLHSIAGSDISVLLVGETGVGKEMIAQTLHLSGSRASGPFVAINCAALPADLAEAELFGIGEKVATNVNRRSGKMALAHRGTLFLDELSSFAPEIQAKVLRAIETREIVPVGESRPLKVDFRLVSATNQSPVELRTTGKLREDLYHRIAAVEIHIPPLRERRGDLEILMMGILQQLSRTSGKQLTGISRRLFAALLEYSYPGNVRELINALSAVVALAHPGEVLDVNLLPEHMLAIHQTGKMERPDFAEPPDVPQEGLHDVVNQTTMRLVIQALTLHRGNITKAAGHLHVTVLGLRKMIKRFNLDVSEFK